MQSAKTGKNYGIKTQRGSFLFSYFAVNKLIKDKTYIVFIKYTLPAKKKEEKYRLNYLN